MFLKISAKKSLKISDPEFQGLLREALEISTVVFSLALAETVVICVFLSEVLVLYTTFLLFCVFIIPALEVKISYSGSNTLWRACYRVFCISITSFWLSMPAPLSGSVAL